MKVVLDTNVIISAFATRGLSKDIFELCLQEHKIILSNYILDEIFTNLQNKIKLPNKEINDIIKFLKNEVQLVIPVELPDDICRDKKDIPIIGTALAGKAEVIITGDRDLLVLNTFRKIMFLSPREFWNYLKK